MQEEHQSGGKDRKRGQLIRQRRLEALRWVHAALGCGWTGNQLCQKFTSGQGSNQIFGFHYYQEFLSEVIRYICLKFFYFIPFPP